MYIALKALKYYSSVSFLGLYGMVSEAAQEPSPVPLSYSPRAAGGEPAKLHQPIGPVTGQKPVLATVQKQCCSHRNPVGVARLSPGPLPPGLPDRPCTWIHLPHSQRLPVVLNPERTLYTTPVHKQACWHRDLAGSMHFCAPRDPEKPYAWLQLPHSNYLSAV